MTARKRWGAFGALLAVTALAVAVAGTGLGGSATNAASPIVIGWAFDSKGNMAPFDGPALAAAKVRIGQINARGGVLGRPLKIETCDTNNNNPAKAKSCAAQLLGKGSHIIFTTCDVDFATPVVQESIKARQADDRAVHRHRPDGAEALRRERASSRSASATSPRTRARRWPSTRTGRAGGRRTWPRTRCSSTSRTSSRRSTSASRSSAARSPAGRATRPARTTSTPRSAG